MTFPSWFKTEMSTLKFQTFSSAIMQSDSRSTQRDSRKVLSKILLIWMQESVSGNPISRCGAAIGPISTLIKIVPSLGLVGLGVTISHDTCANTLVSPKLQITLPKFLPKNNPKFLNSVKSRLSTRSFSRIAFSTKVFSQFDNTVSLIFNDFLFTFCFAEMLFSSRVGSKPLVSKNIEKRWSTQKFYYKNLIQIIIFLLMANSFLQDPLRDMSRFWEEIDQVVRWTAGCFHTRKVLKLEWVVQTFLCFEWWLRGFWLELLFQFDRLWFPNISWPRSVWQVLFVRHCWGIPTVLNAFDCKWLWAHRRVRQELSIERMIPAARLLFLHEPEWWTWTSMEQKVSIE